MKNKYKIILIICVIIGICSILVGSIAYYRIVVEGSIKGSTGNAVFVLKDENSNVWNNKEINLGKVNPGDSGEFTVTMDASGSTVDMYATLELDRGNLPTNLKFYTTSDHKSELHKYYSFLETTNQTETLTIYWYWNPYIDDIEDSKFINVESIEANIRVGAVQISEYAMMKNGYDSTTGGTEFWSDTYKPYIRTITFGNDLSNLPSGCTEENLCWDVSYDANQNKKVYGYLIDSGLTIDETDTSTSTTITKTLYNLYIVSEAPIFAPINCDKIFSFFKHENNKYKSNLVQINFNNNFNTSKVTSMRQMFDRCSSLVTLDLSGFNTSNVTNVYGMFYECSSLTNLDLSSFNTSKVTTMGLMFSQCDKIFELDVSGFNTSNVTDMSAMFQTCLSLKYLNISSFNTSKVTDMSFMFRNIICDIDISRFNTSKVTDMTAMFYNCRSKSLDLSSFNTSNVTNMSYMFWNSTLLERLNLGNFDTSTVTDMTAMFYNCSKLKKLDIDNFNMKNVTLFSDSDTDGIFENCANLTTTINITNANVTNYTDMFNGAATESGAKIVVNYTTETETLVDQMIATKSANSNVVKGSLVS